MGATWSGPATQPLPEPVDSIIVFAPAGELIPLAMQSLKKAGTVSLAGIHMSNCPEMPYTECLFHEKTLTSVEANTRGDGEALFAEASIAAIKPQVVTYPFEEANQALIDLKQDGIQGTAVLVHNT